MDIERKKAFLVQAAYYGAIGAAVLLALKYLFPPLSPFIAGFAIAWLLHRPSKALSKKYRLPQSLAAFLVSVVFYAVVFVAAIMAAVQVISAIENVVPQIPVIYSTKLLPFFTASLDKLEVHMQDFDPEVLEVFDKMTQQLFSYLEQLVSSISVFAVRFASGVITGLPSVILTVILTVVSTFFISLDFDSIIRYAKGMLPGRMQSTVSETVTTGVASVRKILGSYILIMIMSFMELSAGLLLLKIPYAVGLALIISVIDIMPVLGTGLVLIPWSLICLVLRNYPLALGIAMLYIIMLVVRNVVEPKLVGSQMGLHPVVTLSSMFVGLEFFGIAGLFGCPIALSMFIKLRASRKQQMATQKAD
ncbi:MAG: sporulation integral membrane protein YtvI [Clostridia bacterium]|nr:sporulation integral membrane protein YtvI [Clostridia bacterium]